MQRNSPSSFKVILLTCYPPPFGGVAVLARRLFEGLKSKGIDVEVASENQPPEEESLKWVGRYRNWVWRRLIRPAAPNTIVHYFSDAWPVRAALGGLAGIGKFRCVFGVNNSRTPATLAAHSPLVRRPLTWCARLGKTQWVAVSDLVEKQILELGVPAQRVTVIPSFVRPSDKEIHAPLPPKIAEFLRTHNPVLSSNASRLAFHNGEDLYGVDLCIRATRGLRDRYPRAGFVFFISDPGDRVYWNRLQRMIDECGVRDHFQLFDHPVDEICPVWRASSVFVRATNCDGDPLSVREALFVGTPVVASNVSPRPAPCLLFPNRDLDSLVASLDKCLSNLEAHRTAAREYGDPTHAIDAFLEVYRKALSA